MEYGLARAGRSIELCHRAGYLPSKDIVGVMLYCTRLIVELAVAHRQGQLGAPRARSWCDGSLVTSRHVTVKVCRIPAWEEL